MAVSRNLKVIGLAKSMVMPRKDAFSKEMRVSPDLKQAFNEFATKQDTRRHAFDLSELSVNLDIEDRVQERKKAKKKETAKYDVQAISEEAELTKKEKKALREEQ